MCVCVCVCVCVCACTHMHASVCGVCVCVCMCVCVCGCCWKDEFNNPMTPAFRAKLFRERVMEVCQDYCPCWLSKLLSSRREENVSQAGGRCISFGVTCVIVIFHSMLSSGPQDDCHHAHLKARMPHSGPIPAPTTKTLAAVDSRQSRAHQIGHYLGDHKGGGLLALVPLSKPATTVNGCRTRTVATWSALTFKTAVERESCFILKTLYQHREAMSHPSSQVGAPLSKHIWGSLSKSSRTAQVRHGHSVKTSSFADSKSCLLAQGTNTSQESLPHFTGCVCCRVCWCVGAWICRYIYIYICVMFLLTGCTICHLWQASVHGETESEQYQQLSQVEWWIYGNNDFTIQMFSL